MSSNLFRPFLIFTIVCSFYLLSPINSYAGNPGACCGCAGGLCSGGFSGICGDDFNDFFCENVIGGEYQGDNTTCSPIDPCYEPTDCDDTFCQISEEACMNCAEANEGATCQWCGEVELCFTPFGNCPTPTSAPCDDPSCQISEEACMNCAEANEGATCQWCGEVELCFTPFGNCPTPTPTPTVTPTPTPEPEGTVILPTLGQWGMIIAAIILGFFAVIALRRSSES